MNKLPNILLRAFCGSMIIVSPLIANDSDAAPKQEESASKLAEQTDGERIAVGSRAIAQAETVKVQEERAAEEKKAVAEKLQARGSSEGSEHVGTPVVIKEEARPNPEVLPEVAPEVQGMTKKAFYPKAYTYYTTHAGALHQPVSVGLMGDTVQLEDGSIWTISSGDSYKTLNWLTSDAIIILPNSFFSIYNYKIINVNTGVICQANLYLGPIYNGYYTKWITAIDYASEFVWLNDGTCWQMSGYDYSTVKKWLPNDTVIIGINDGSFSGSNPNILINVNMLNYAKGKAL